jgi:hypothetical protein
MGQFVALGTKILLRRYQRMRPIESWRPWEEDCLLRFPTVFKVYQMSLTAIEGAKTDVCIFSELKRQRPGPRTKSKGSLAIRV